MINYPNYKVAVTQIAPVFLNLEASTEKACDYIKKAAEEGAKIIAFPEAYLPGYPYWIMYGDPFAYGLKYWDKFYRNSVEIPSDTIRRLSKAAKENHIYVCISVTEKDGGSLYLTQLWFDNEGNLIGKHRKTRPTGPERTVWGEGDGSTMPVFDTPLGRLGGLQCWEHKMPTNLLAMASMNEQVHIGAWPGAVGAPDHLFNAQNDIVNSLYYASTLGTFVLMSTQIFTQEILDMLEDTKGQGLGGGHACIINPRGTIISERLDEKEEGILYADIDLNDIIACKYFIDPAGHYSKPNICKVVFNQECQTPIIKTGAQMNYYINADEIEEK